MWPNSQETEEVLNGKLTFCAVKMRERYWIFKFYYHLILAVEIFHLALEQKLLRHQWDWKTSYTVKNILRKKL